MTQPPATGCSLHQVLVNKFMALAGQDIPEVPTVPTDDVIRLRLALCFEELLEMAEAFGYLVAVDSRYRLMVAEATEKTPERFVPMIKSVKDLVFEKNPKQKVDLVEVADACCDLRVTTTGTLTACGIRDWELQSMVDRSNLEKFGPGGYRARNGKWIKPPNWRAPDLAEELKRQGWKGEERETYVADGI